MWSNLIGHTTYRSGPVTVISENPDVFGTILTDCSCCRSLASGPLQLIYRCGSSMGLGNFRDKPGPTGNVDGEDRERERERERE